MFLRVVEILWQNSFLVGKSWSSCKHDRFEKSSGQWKFLIKSPHRDSKFGALVYLLPLSLYRERSVGPASHTGDGPCEDRVCHG